MPQRERMSPRQFVAVCIGLVLPLLTLDLADALLAESFAPYVGMPTARMIGVGLWVAPFVAVALWLEQRTRRR
jgi:hypothetical protein